MLAAKDIPRIWVHFSDKQILISRQNIMKQPLDGIFILFRIDNFQNVLHHCTRDPLIELEAPLELG